VPAETDAVVRHVVLCGTPGCGKSTVGALVAKTLRRPFIDIDKLIEQQTGQSVRAIFEREGETAFRTRERAAVVRALGSATPLVIALGGGSLENDATAADLTRHTLVWLDAPIWALASRVMTGEDRPLLAGDPQARLRELNAKRQPLFERANLRVDATDEPRRVASVVVAALRKGRHLIGGRA
jgi:shikimate kinase